MILKRNTSSISTKKYDVSNTCNSIRPSESAYGIVTKTVHKNCTLPEGGGVKGDTGCLGLRGGVLAGGGLKGGGKGNLAEVEGFCGLGEGVGLG